MSAVLSAALVSVATALLVVGLLVGEGLMLVGLSAAASAAAGGVLVLACRRNRGRGARVVVSDG